MNNPHTIVIISMDKDFHPMLAFLKCTSSVVVFSFISGIGFRIVMIVHKIGSAQQKRMKKVSHEILPFSMFMVRRLLIKKLTQKGGRSNHNGSNKNYSHAVR